MNAGLRAPDTRPVGGHREARGSTQNRGAARTTPRDGHDRIPSVSACLEWTRVSRHGARGPSAFSAATVNSTRKYASYATAGRVDCMDWSPEPVRCGWSAPGRTGREYRGSGPQSRGPGLSHPPASTGNVASSVFGRLRRSACGAHDRDLIGLTRRDRALDTICTYPRGRKGWARSAARIHAAPAESGHASPPRAHHRRASRRCPPPPLHLTVALG